MNKKENFTIEGSVALKKAFIEESKFERNVINFNNYLTSSITGRSFTSTSRKSLKHFILPNQYYEALEYAKEYFKKNEFKVGDWVIGWHANLKEYKNKAWEIKEIFKGTSNEIYARPKLRFATSIEYIRKATPEEIEKAQVKTFKLGEYTAIIKNNLIEVEGKGEVTYTDWRKVFGFFTQTVLCGKYNTCITINTIDIGCIKNIPFQDFIDIYEYINKDLNE